MYEYRATLVKVVDGDTYDFLVDLGFNISFEIRVRLDGLDTYELRGEQSEIGYLSKQDAKRFLMTASYLIVRTKKDKTGKYGRYLADVIRDPMFVNIDGEEAYVESLRTYLILTGNEKDI